MVSNNSQQQVLVHKFSQTFHSHFPSNPCVFASGNSVEFSRIYVCFYSMKQRKLLFLIEYSKMSLGVDVRESAADDSNKSDDTKKKFPVWPIILAVVLGKNKI